MKPLKDLSAPELVRLMRLGHPNQHGEPYDRVQVMEECARRGVQLLEELGWPSSPETVYYNRHIQASKALGEIISASRLNPLRHEMHMHEDKVRKAVGFPPSNTGIECTRLKEWRKALKNAAPEVKEVVKECIRLHKGFYEQNHAELEAEYYQEAYELKPISKLAKPGESDCEYNIMQVARWLGLNVDVPEPVKSLPEQSIYGGVWLLVEHWEPKRTEAPGQTVLTIFQEA